MYETQTAQGGAMYEPSREMQERAERDMQKQREAERYRPRESSSDTVTLGDAFNQLCEEVGALQEMQREFAGRLGPILTPEPDTKEGGELPRPLPSLSPATSEVLSFMWDVRRMRNELRRVMERVNL